MTKGYFHTSFNTTLVRVRINVAELPKGSSIFLKAFPSGKPLEAVMYGPFVSQTDAQAKYRELVQLGAVSHKYSYHVVGYAADGQEHLLVNIG